MTAARDVLTARKVMGMTIPSPTEAPPLLTDDDVLGRVGVLVDRALVRRRLWLMWVGADGYQSPVISQIDDLGPVPDGRFVDALARLLAGTVDPGDSVILTLEREGPPWLPDDRTWADALRRTASHAGVALRGLLIADDRGVRPAP